MRKIIFIRDLKTVELCNINEQSPVFAKRYGKIVGMVVQEEGRWILKVGGCSGATGYHDTLQECLESCLVHEYEFFVN